MKDHDSYANKTWGGFCGQVIGDEARIWIEPEGERKTEKENRCLTFQSQKKVERNEPRTTPDTDAALLCR